MSRSSLLVTVFFIMVLLAGCGAAFVGAVGNPGTTFTMSGMVTVVQLGVASDGHGTVLTVTVVTLVDVGITKIMTFCGDQRPQFPVGETVKAEYASGVLCSTAVSVTCSPPASSNANLNVIRPTKGMRRFETKNMYATIYLSHVTVNSYRYLPYQSAGK